jgi:hypothetical protein
VSAGLIAFSVDYHSYYYGPERSKDGFIVIAR